MLKNIVNNIHYLFNFEDPQEFVLKGFHCSCFQNTINTPVANRCHYFQNSRALDQHTNGASLSKLTE